MIVKNITRNTVISENLKIASSFLDRMFGLLNKNNSRSLLFKTRFGIHTFGLKNPIDIIVIDVSSQAAILKSLKQNRLFIYNPAYNTIIELPLGSILKSKTKKGDVIKIG